MLFFSGNQTRNYSLIYEIGSGSVLLSIIESDPSKATPTIIWSHREYITTNQTPNLTRTAKKIGAALMNVGMLCNSEGIQALAVHNSRARISRSYATLAAPWSYTINKTVEYKTDNDIAFTVDLDLVHELADTAVSNTEAELSKHDHLNAGLEIINHRIISLTANGYEISDVLGKTAKHVTMSHVSSLALIHMTQIISEVHTKTQPKVHLELQSFMMVFFYVVRCALPSISDYCLLDITHEAAELGVVRDKKLTYCSYIIGGTNTLAQTISKLTELPYETVMTYLKEPTEKDRLKHIPEKKQELVTKVLAQYRNDISSLFFETDEILITPRTIYLHCDPLLESFYTEQIQLAICKPQQSTCEVRPVTGLLTNHLRTTKVVAKSGNNDTALDIAAYFFHTDGDNYGVLEDKKAIL